MEGTILVEIYLQALNFTSFGMGGEIYFQYSVVEHTFLPISLAPQGEKQLLSPVYGQAAAVLFPRQTCLLEQMPRLFQTHSSNLSVQLA